MRMYAFLIFLSVSVLLIEAESLFHLGPDQRFLAQEASDFNRSYQQLMGLLRCPLTHLVSHKAAILQPFAMYLRMFVSARSGNIYRVLYMSVAVP